MVHHKGDENRFFFAPGLQTLSGPSHLPFMEIILVIPRGQHPECHITSRLYSELYSPHWQASMSHTHSHAPGQPSHSHGPPQQQQQQQTMVMRPPDPVMQALIEQSFIPVDITLGTPDNVTAHCGPHSLEKCTDCDVDYTTLNRISKTLHMNPGLRCPPPPNVVSQKLSAAISNTKEEGNVCLFPVNKAH